MRLYLVRHGKAEDYTTNDHDRQLTGEGAARLETEAQVIARLGSTRSVFTAARASAPARPPRSSRRHWAKGLRSARRVNFGFTVDSVAALVAGLPWNAEVMFVGHNPSMSQVVHALTGANVEMKTGSLARIDIDSPPPVLHGHLVWLLAPKVFDALGQ